MVRHGQGGRDAQRGRRRLNVPDEVLRPACEAAVEVARLGASAQPPLPTPGPLRPLVRLRTVPDRALPAVRRVLDGDEAFRAVVAAATTEELVGRASYLFLHRPEGWERSLATEAGVLLDAATEAEEARAEATAARQLAAVEEALRRSQADAAELRAALAGVKHQLAEERKARRDADSEVGRLRRRLEGLAGQAAADAPDEVTEPVHDTSALLDRLATLERRLAEPRSPDPQPVERALDALDRVRLELGGWLASATAPPSAPSAPSAPAVPPASGPRRRPSPLPPAVFDDSVEAAAHLVRLAGAVVLVDGYNVSKLRHPDLPLPEQRRWLLDAAGALAARCDAEVHVVFDGADQGPRIPAPGPRRGVAQARYTPSGIEADDVLLDLTADVPIARPVIVVSDDRRVRQGAADLGANVVGSEVFVALLGRRR